MTSPNSHAQQFLDRFGREETSRVCSLAGTNLRYYLQCCKGKRHFSRSLAEKLESASEGRMDKVALVFGERPAECPPGALRAQEHEARP
jgi:hypothetical protein